MKDHKPVNRTNPRNRLSSVKKKKRIRQKCDAMQHERKEILPRRRQWNLVGGGGREVWESEGLRKPWLPIKPNRPWKFSEDTLLTDYGLFPAIRFKKWIDLIPGKGCDGIKNVAWHLDTIITVHLQWVFFFFFVWASGVISHYFSFFIKNKISDLFSNTVICELRRLDHVILSCLL